MFSKCLKAVLALCLVAGLASCDSKVGEEPPPPESQEFGGTQCLTDAKPVAKAFVVGDANKEELEAAWDCIGSAVEKFKRYVRGNSSDRYTAQELATFLEKNFLDPKEKVIISEQLQTEFMKLKQVFVGGSREYLTRGELDKTIALVKSLRTITVNLNPYMKVISLNWEVSESPNMQSDVRHFEEANKELQNAARMLASLIEQNAQGYNLSDFVVLMQEVGQFFGEEWEFPSVIQTYMPVIKKVKKALAGGDENSITPNEWRRFTLLGARGYVQFLRYHYFIKSVPETGTGYRLGYLARTVEDVLSVFQDLVAEKPEGVVSRDEVFDLLKTLEIVWPEFKVSSGLVFEGMKVKQLFFGGSVDSLTTTDFETARLKVSRIKTLIERFMPFYSIYGREWDPDMYDADEAQKLFMESQFVLEATVREAGVLFEGSYDLNDLNNIVREIEILYPPKDGRGLADQVKSYLPLVIDAKNMVLGGNDSSLRKSNWSVLLGFAARAYSDFLYYQYFLMGESLQQPVNLSYFSVFGNQTLNILRDLLLVKKENQFTRVELNKIVKHFIRLELLPGAINEQSADKLVSVVLNNMLVAPEARLSGHKPDALTLTSVEVGRQEMQIWIDTELMFAQMAEGWKPEEGLTAKDLLAVLKKTEKNLDAHALPLQAALTELILSVQSPVPMTTDYRGFVIISNKFEQLYTFKSLRDLNRNRAVARLLIRSFANDLNRINTFQGATLPEVEGAFNELKSIFVEMGLLDPKSTSFASSRFREANIFVPHSDGNSLASQTEITDLIGMIWSGVGINSRLRTELVKKCFGRDEEVTDNSLVTLSCARAAYKDAMPAIMSATPEYIKFMKKASADEWAYYMNNVFMAAGYVPNDKNLAKMGDIALTPHVIQYVEMVFARFDKNKDNIISTGEAIKAYPAFKGLLKELAADQLKSGVLKEKDLLDVFTFILRYGKPPTTLMEQARFLFKWKGKQDKWDVWADRVQLAQILGYIAEQVSKSPSAKLVQEPASQDALEKAASQL
ncbi:hypothetical protein AB1A81_11085 [Bdellovibrio bacteriovorus]|uniref:EF-hand domain-containing protein n=1 Tax=Bdellovibrio bacteriovorus (strain ATCC 15356 / DSM 50701 / NCIMB 9529 / HD100) TaxID=264462 RepID=Q6MKH7_BDEBA|nr:hypothetical protein [Bdellovibrio bacteriovorus]AHZ84939.1 hypothetical protein EP01_08310 [Bdellovibrio bacteriovorus]BEV68826.1 hypothetical protein Bb109J_c2246 [Bdellovibrio bacteriovorus]CAE80230.1 hypothetical protein predicted by Glimmer/Critica [Bdellovibrio bacteriovorus HD100]